MHCFYDVAIQFNSIQLAEDAVPSQTIQCSKMQFNTMQYNAMQYSAMQNITVQLNSIWIYAMICSTLKFNSMQWNAMQQSWVSSDESGVSSGSSCRLIFMFGPIKAGPCPHNTRPSLFAGFWRKAKSRRSPAGSLGTHLICMSMPRKAGGGGQCKPSSSSSRLSSSSSSCRLWSTNCQFCDLHHHGSGELKQTKGNVGEEEPPHWSSDIHKVD